MDRLTYEEVIKIFDGAEFPFISISRAGVFIDSLKTDENSPEYAIIRGMAYNHPQKDTTKPLFTFPCTINELRNFLHDNDESCLLSGVIYIDKGKKYTASEVIDLMVEATLLETSLLPDDEKMGVSSQQYKKQFLDDHQLLKNDYQESMTEYLKRHLITVLGDETEQKLKNISLENIMGDVINWLQGERFAVFSNDLATTASKTQKPTIPKKTHEALSSLLAEIEQRASKNNVPFYKFKMFGTKAQLHDLAKLHCGCLFEKSPHTFYDYLKNSGLCKFNNGNRWSPLYYQLFPEYPKLENRETRVKIK